MKVGFVVGGTQKGGTTALDRYLREHPEITMGRRKEVHFFDDEDRFGGQAPVDYGAYHRWFDPKASTRLLGEATPIYMYWNAAPPRIRAYNPAMKWILLLRNPVERAYSHWNMERSRNKESLPFRDAVEQEAERCRETAPLQHRVYSYADRGCYVEQVERIWKLFSPGQPLILKSEELQATPGRVIDRICDFLEVDRMRSTDRLLAHVGSYEGGMNRYDRAALIDRFAPEIRRLERLLSWDCSDWLR